MRFYAKSCSWLLDPLPVTEPGNCDSQVLLLSLVCDTTLRQNQLLVSKSMTVENNSKQLFLKLWDEKQKLYEEEM